MKARFRQTLCLLFLVFALMLCSSCGKPDGRTVPYDTFTVRTSRNLPESSGEAAALPGKAAPPGASEAEIHYIVNLNTKVFHAPDCAAAASMLEKNKWSYRGARDALIEMGYAPCKECSP